MTNEENWARALTDRRVAQDLRTLADDVRRFDPAMRAALLRSTAERIEELHRIRTETTQDQRALDQIAVGLSTKHEWDSGELEWIALAVSAVRPFDGNGDTTPREYMDLFERETGRDPRPYADEEED